MPIANTRDSYGALAKFFHWLTALLILVQIALGLVANEIAEALREAARPSQEDIARVAFLFSLHKTLGLVTFFVALLRILWALSQPKPDLLNGDRPLEAWAAETAHWLLCGALVAVPLSGWIAHAATTGFAPIWWPFGQSLPFVPRDPRVAEIAATTHSLLQWLLAITLAAHVAGALKHHLIDGDATLRRMLPGGVSARPTTRQPGHLLPFLSALAILGAVLGGAAALGPHAPRQARVPALTAAESEWRVTDGTLEAAITQMGSRVTGRFEEWTARIAYSETPDATGRHGMVEVTVVIPSLRLGMVTDQAMGPDFLDAANHPVATFTADILASDETRLARGTLTIKGRSVPVELPFSLRLEGDISEAEGGLTLDRRDFGIGTGIGDAATLGFAVEVAFRLTAMRASGG